MSTNHGPKDGRSPNDPATTAARPEPLIWNLAVHVDGEVITFDLTRQARDEEREPPHRLMLGLNQLRDTMSLLTGRPPAAPAPTRPRPSKAYTPWTDEKDQELADKVAEGWTTADLAAHFGRSRGAVSSRVERLMFRGLISSDVDSTHE
ncbi:hypothetical protein GCM10022399_37470 [Terrabacter ginsenosidimutans]|uniref:Helix-turn-helix domain-containing protein n=1 Tax=Terrabacter ginsenosidimutans TaxID=490575 RepID=A0ABP7EHT3_9MICO